MTNANFLFHLLIYCVCDSSFVLVFASTDDDDDDHGCAVDDGRMMVLLLFCDCCDASR